MKAYSPVPHDPPAVAQARLAWALLDWWDAEGFKSTEEHVFMEREVVRLFGPRPGEAA